MQTDRPDFTEGPQTVQPGRVQAELGYTYTEDDEAGSEFESHSLPELLLRVGLLDDLELRIAWAGYIREKTDTTSTNTDIDGVSDLSIGFKHSMYKQDQFWMDFSIIGEIEVPTGSNDITSDEVTPALKLLWAKDLNDTFGIAGNVNFVSAVADGDRFFEIQSSETLGIGLSETVGFYLEHFGLYPAESTDVSTTTHFINGGFTYLVHEDLQLDARVGRGLNDAADDLFAGAGVTVRY